MNDAYGSYGTPAHSWPHLEQRSSVIQFSEAISVNVGASLDGGQIILSGLPHFVHFIFEA